jgi:hypothetical protein
MKMEQTRNDAESKILLDTAFIHKASGSYIA